MNIPKIIHYIWFNFKNTLKGEIIPQKYLNNIEEVKQMNPTYKVYVWYESDANLLVKNKFSYFYKYFMILDPIEKVDSFKYILMYHFGGIYLDTDNICYKSLDDLLYKYKNYDIILSEEISVLKEISIANSILISIPFHNLWLDVIQYIIKWNINKLKYIDQNMNVLFKTGPIMMFIISKLYKNDKKIIILPKDYLYDKSDKGYIYHKGDGTWININFTLYKFILIFYIIFVCIFIFHLI